VADPVFLVREPHVAVRPRDIKFKESLTSATRYSVTFPGGEKQPIFPPLVLAEPDVAVRSGGNADRAAFWCGDIELL
jgi:hypothetical protein